MVRQGGPYIYFKGGSFIFEIYGPEGPHITGVQISHDRPPKSCAVRTPQPLRKVEDSYISALTT